MGLHLRVKRFAETERSGPNGCQKLVADTRFEQTNRTRCNTCQELVLHRFRVRGGCCLEPLFGDAEGRAKIARFSSSIVKHTAHESLKTVPGYKIVARSIRDLNESDKQEVDVKAMQADLRRLKKEFSEYRKVHEPEVDVKALQADVLRLEKELRKRRKQVQLVKPSADLKSPNTANIHSAANQKPEDVIRVFMMKELDHFS